MNGTTSCAAGSSSPDSVGDVVEKWRSMFADAEVLLSRF